MNKSLQKIVWRTRGRDTVRGGVLTTNLYGSNAAQGMTDAYNAIVDSLYGSLEQIRLKPLFDQIGIRVDNGGFTFDLSGVQAALANSFALDAPGGVSDLLSFNKIAANDVTWRKEA